MVKTLRLESIGVTLHKTSSPLPQVHFSDEPPDAYLYEGRDVWTMMDKAEVIIASLCGFFILLITPHLQHFNFLTYTPVKSVQVKLNIPFMTNSSKSVTFAAFFGLIKELTQDRGLTHREIMDIIR